MYGWQCTEITESDEKVVWKVHPSDGIVPAYSAMDIPQRTYRPQLLDESTHISIRNDEELPKAMNKLYRGECGDFFRTEKKQ